MIAQGVAQLEAGKSRPEISGLDPSPRDGRHPREPRGIRGVRERWVVQCHTHHAILGLDVGHWARILSKIYNHNAPPTHSVCEYHAA